MKSMIRNKVGNKTFTLYVPASHTNAQAFADAVLDGESIVFSQGSVTGTGVGVVSYRDVSLMIQNNTTGQKAYLGFAIKSNKNEDDVISALLNKTFNGVKAEKIVITGMRTVTL